MTTETRILPPPSEEYAELARVLRGALASTVTMDRILDFVDGQAGMEDVWTTLQEDLDLLGLLVPAEHGGVGADFRAAAIVLTELGRALAPVPYLMSCVVAPTLLLASGDDDACRRLLPQLANGQSIATVDLPAGAREDSWGRHLDAQRTSNAWTLTGSVDGLIDGERATTYLVAADASDAPGVTLFEIEQGAAGVEVEPLESLDPTRPMARLQLFDARATPIGEPGFAAQALTRTRDVAMVALACEQLGGNEAILAQAVEYARERVQFGRPIGSFQGIKHLLAERAVDIEDARSAVAYGTWAVDSASDELSMAAAIARICVSEAYSRTAADNIQVHGGIGFTWEHGAHLHYRRATVGRLLFGDPYTHRDRLVTMVGRSPAGTRGGDSS